MSGEQMGPKIIPDKIITEPGEKNEDKEQEKVKIVKDLKEKMDEIIEIRELVPLIKRQIRLKNKSLKTHEEYKEKIKSFIDFYDKYAGILRESGLSNEMKKMSNLIHYKELANKNDWTELAKAIVSKKNLIPIGKRAKEKNNAIEEFRYFFPEYDFDKRNSSINKINALLNDYIQIDIEIKQNEEQVEKIVKDKSEELGKIYLEAKASGLFDKKEWEKLRSEVDPYFSNQLQEEVYKLDHEDYQGNIESIKSIHSRKRSGAQLSIPENCIYNLRHDVYTTAGIK